MKKRPPAQEEGGNWMDTYGDLVTLLLCFFVLLYSISSVDQTKWENLVKSMNPNAANEVSQIVTDPQGSEGTEEVPGVNATQVETEFQELYNNLLSMAEGDSSNMEVAQGDGYQFITFKNSVFFDGDSYVLRDEGKQTLDQFSEVLAKASDSIKEIQILGHTTQADPNVPNEVTVDRVLSASRSAVVTSYIQEKNILDPSKLVSVGYGQFRPIDTFDTAEGRARNRRVEMLITKTGSVEKSLDEYYSQVYGDEKK